ncbi:MAG: 2-hydroxy-6-oxononadienedioate/2-hydroxy-6-oxononatrienedioate hydrolase [Nitrospirae bacterium]|nr:MAG: putative 2-hydroxy-6-ketonona-2,4-dienedioate hydrolase [Nitrospira sp. OLB3]MBV6468658.1 2-hydroxy-6-oxononadienedioate/2-hydroxy-6-oxononatrienedioate hydrolase [Nitrospirota bacterium]MCE7963994.1 alpha/beta hydrolase [Nitrospira sp. NTP2]MCK6492815.1 alpha/beta hydrolase [Nitrospira sp.]MEB2337157.1 alpha/beta hydrolase [Nitrospirales bacterium]
MRLAVPLARLSGTILGCLLIWCLTGILMTGCAAAPDIPPWFDAIHRLPVKTATVGGHRLAYLDHGDGPPLILLHGYGGSMWQWEYQQGPLAERFRIITPDLLGSGFSDKPELDYRPDVLIESVRGLMDALGLRQATLIGNSMGGGVAIGMALTHPEHVDRLILIDGLPDRVRERLSSPLMKRAVNTRMPLWLARLGTTLFGSRTVDAVLKEIVYNQNLLTQTVLDRSNRNRQRGNVLGPLFSLRDQLPLWENQFARRLGDIRQPTLVLWGEQDRLFPPQVGRDLQAAIPNARFVLIPNAGHIPQWEQPQAVNREITEFLQP